MKPFSQLTRRGQSRRLRRLVLTALDAYDLQVDELRLVSDETNVVYRVTDTQQRRFVLRIGTPVTCHDRTDVESELVWLTFIGGRLGEQVVSVVPACSGEPMLTVDDPLVPEPRDVVLFNWLPGRHLASSLTAANLYRLGQLSAELHQHAADFAPPAGFHIRRCDCVLPYADDQFARVEPELIFDSRFAHYMPDQRRDLYRRAMDRAAKTIGGLFDSNEPPRVLHNDLHPWNVKCDENRLYLFDFEDIMWGYPLQDVATTLYYLWLQPRYQVHRDAYREGYSLISPWPESYPGQIEELMLARALILVNFVLASTDPEMQAMARDYVTRVGKRLSKLLSEADNVRR